jgi:methionyl-tRNA formyltransferase
MMHTDEGPKQLRIFQSRLYYGDVQLSSGQCKVHDKKLLCGTQDGIIEILQLQREGKNKMDAAGFINGLRSDGFLVE